jgi:hypothetical protein
MEVGEHFHVVYQATYYRGWATNFHWEMKGMRREHDQVVAELEKVKSEDKKLLESMKVL